MNNKVIKKIHNKSLFMKRRNLFVLTGAAIVASVPITSSIAISTNTAINSFRGAYSLGGLNFDSYSQLMNYVNSNSKIVDVEGNNSKWTVTLNGITKTYSDPNQLRNDLYNNYIKTRKVKTDVNLADYAEHNGVLGLTNQDVWKHVSDEIKSGNTVYQGANDQTFSTEDEAYNSYFQTKQGYIFNGITFSDKNALKDYLEKDYFPNKTIENNTVVITSPNGKSLPIDLTKNDAYDLLSNFVTENADIRLNYTTNENGVINITKNNISSVIDKVSLKDLNYQHVQSNEGESRYIIDNSDNADLIGPYFYKGILDIPSFKNKDMWKKVNGVSKSVYAESKVDSVVGSFFSSIINDDNNLNKIQAESGKTNTLLFRTLLSVNVRNSEGTTEEKSYDEWFINELKTKSPDLADAVIKANDSMMTGKKYNSFYKIPVLYSFLMQRAITWGLGQDVVNLIVDYFTNVCNFIQDVLEFASLYSSDLLISKDKKTKFNMVDFFQIGNPEYDINTSTAYFLNEIKTKYPNLVAMCYAYSQAENNISLAGGMIPFDSVGFDFLWESGIIDAQDLYIIKEDLRSVYETFSQLDIKDMVQIYVKNNKNPEVKKIESESDTSKWGDKLKEIKTSKTNQDLYFLLSGIGAKNNQYFSMAEGVLGTEISIFLESGTLVKGGYLDRLSKSRKNVDLLPLFINLVKANEGKVKAYRIYLAFMLDVKTKSNIFADGKTDMPYDEFARRLSYLITIVFGSASLVAKSLTGVYAAKPNDVVDGFYTGGEVIQVYKNPIFDIIDVDNTTIGDSVSIHIGDGLDNSSLRQFDGDMGSIHGSFLNPNLNSGAFDVTDFSVQLDSLTNAILNQSPTDIDRIINEGLTSTPISRTPSVSTIASPMDNVQISQAASFDDRADLVSLHSVIDATHEVHPDFYQTKKNWWSGYTSKFEKFKKGISTILDYSLEIFAGALSVLELAFFFYDLFKETYTQNFYQYTTVDGTSFYWNGGLSVSKYLGFVNYDISDISQMELVDPVQITLPQVEEFYYYSGLKYYNPDELKRKVLSNYINGIDTPRNPKFERYYALLNNEDSSAKTIEELINKVISSLGITKNTNGSFEISKLNKDSPCIQALSASYDYGYIISDSDNNVTLIQNITNNIRPANFVSLPELGKNNIANGKTTSFTKYPGKYWDGSKVIENKDVTNVLVDNSANDLKDGIKDQMIWKQENFKNSDHKAANDASLKSLYEMFKQKFSIASKELLNIGNTTNKYSQLPNGTTVQNIYEVTDDRTGRIYSFYDYNAATSFLNANAKFAKYTDNKGVRIYFKGMYFNNWNELMSWVHDNMVSIR